MDTAQGTLDLEPMAKTTPADQQDLDITIVADDDNYDFIYSGDSGDTALGQLKVGMGSYMGADILHNNDYPYITVGSWATDTKANTAISGQLNLEGTDADIKINGRSLVSTLEALEQRLNILTPNPQLEKEWDELRALGEQYRAAEARLKEQSDMWAKLKAMPPPPPLT